MDNVVGLFIRNADQKIIFVFIISHPNLCLLCFIYSKKWLNFLSIKNKRQFLSFLKFNSKAKFFIEISKGNYTRFWHIFFQRRKGIIWKFFLDFFVDKILSFWTKTGFCVYVFGINRFFGEWTVVQTVDDLKCFLIRVFEL